MPTEPPIEPPVPPVTPDQIKNAPVVIKIPNTLIMDKDGTMAKEWIYFFNDIGRAVDQQITANLPELTQQLIDNVVRTLELGDDAENIRAELISINARVIITEDDLVIVKDDVAANKSGLASANSTIAGHTTSISSLTGRMNTKDSQVTALQSTTATHTTNIAANTGSISTLQTQVQAQADAMTALEARVAALEAAP